ncbi:retrovirus-related pol polyprotein from transposon TNT 1-94 [Tanacetum coccineum]
MEHQGWVDAIQEELNQFYRNRVWTLVPLSRGKLVMGSKWLFRNKKDEFETILRNKARLVAQGYSQEEGIDYDETFTPLARMEAIRIFLAYATYMNFKVFQMNVKIAFLNGKYQVNPKESHLNDVNRIFIYLKGTPTLGLWYPKCSGFDLKGYLDSDYTCNMDRKITSGACQLLGGKLVCYSANKQQLVAMSFVEAEYVVVVRTKYIDVRNHFIKDHIIKGDIELHLIPTEYQLADIFTKPLDEPTFTRLKAKLVFETGDDMETDWPHNTQAYSQPLSSTNKVRPSDEHRSPTHPESPPASQHEEPTSTKH